MKPIHIFSGHFGSGKTEVAINFALSLRKQGQKVCMVDFDIVNPYFRTNDAKETLQKNGISLIANRYASSNLDMPTVPLEIMRAFDDTESAAIFDVGGDDDGAFALGAYKKQFEQNGYEMHLVVNTKRPLTETADDLYEIATRIEAASGLHFTDIYNNTNLSQMSDTATNLSVFDEITALSQNLNIPIAKNCGLPPVISGLPSHLRETGFPITITIPKPWEI